jgi:hypothetical protein
MKPENRIQIKRNALTFSIIVLLLSVAIGSSAWSFLGEGMQRTRDETQLATAERDRIRAELDSLKEANRSSHNLEVIISTIERTDSMVSSLESNYANAKGFADLRNAGLLDVRIDRPSETEKRLLSAYQGIVSDLGSYGDFIFNSRADPGSMLKQLDDCNRKIMVLEEQAKKAAGSGAGTQKPPTPVTGTTSPCDITCEDCKQRAAMLEEVRRMAKDNNEFVNYDKKNKVNFVAVPKVDSKGRVRDSREREEWAKQQYIGLVLKLRQTFGLEQR